jgi:hypothetical protein
VRPTQPHTQRVPEAVCPGVKQQVHEDDYSPPSITEVKKVGLVIQVLITVYNATIYVNFNNTIAFDSLKLVKCFNIIKIYTPIFYKMLAIRFSPKRVQGIHQHAPHITE